MNDLIRTTLYTGAGTIVLAKAKFKELIEELIQNNELTQEEGQRYILQAINAMEDKKMALEAKWFKAIDQVLLAFKLPLRTEIEAKLDALVSECKSLTNFKSTAQHPTKAS